MCRSALAFVLHLLTRCFSIRFYYYINVSVKHLLPSSYKKNIMSKKIAMTISQYNYDKLQELEGATMNDKIKTLFAIVAPYMPEIKYTEKNKSIKVEPSTRDLVDVFRITIGESRDNILTRAFLILDEIQKHSSLEEWTPFKLTNPYNNLLVIEGQFEINSKELSFNYRGNVFRGKLPPTYIIEGKDLTKELYLWYDNLNWFEIQEKIQSAENFKGPDYILEINY